jgi:hypothetical protein
MKVKLKLRLLVGWLLAFFLAASGATADLSPIPAQAGQGSGGSNISRDATGAQPSKAMPRKTVTATFQDYRGSNLSSRVTQAMMYNQAQDARITLPAQNIYNDGSGAWTPRGWGSATQANAAPLTSATQFISANTTFYGLYQRKGYTLSYNANGGTSTPPSQNAVEYANSSAIATRVRSPLTLATKISKPNATFDGWAQGSATGTKYAAGASIQISANTVMFATWKNGTASVVTQYPQYLGVHTPTDWDENNPSSFNQDGIKEILDAVRTQGSEKRRLAISHTFSYLQWSVDNEKASLTKMLQLAKDNDLPVIIHLDGVNWWSNRPDLWNFWDNAKPGYNTANVDNVERFDWGTGTNTAVKIGWRNWGAQARVAPAPNLASDRFRKAQTEALDKLLPVIKGWYDDLPADKKYLLGGVVFGWELSPYTQAWYFEGGNDLLNLPETNDPVAKWDDVWTSNGQGNILALGYAAAQTLKLPQKSGAITPATIDAICKDYLEFLIKYAVDKYGIDPQRIITHSVFPGFYTKRGGGHTGSAAVSDVADVVSGWSMYYQDYRSLSSTIDKAGGRPWAAIETTPKEEYLTATYLKGLMNYKNNRYVNIFNWKQIKDKPSVINAIRETLDE